MASARRSKKRRDAERAGFRSGFELEVAKQATKDSIKFEYEPKGLTLSYVPKPRKYKPDFLLGNGIIVETKGRFTSFDRIKHILVRASNPELDIRFVFQQDNPINKKSTTRYSDWCVKHNFKYAVGRIPKEWFNERS